LSSFYIISETGVAECSSLLGCGAMSPGRKGLTFEGKYSRTPLIWIDWDGKPSGYA